MALEKNFSNTVSVKAEEKKEIKKLTELIEDDKNTIYNLIFGKSFSEKDK